MKSLKKMNHFYHLTFLKLKNLFIFYIYQIGKRMKLDKKFDEFTNANFKIAISWKTRKISSLFSLNDKKLYPFCKIYYEKCKQCGKDYVGKTKRNCISRWGEHDSPTHKSEPTRHINNHIEHKFEWSILCNAQIKEHLRKIC